MFKQSVFIFSLFLPLTFSTCPDGSVPWPSWVETPDCYVFHSELSAFINAETICNEQNGHLSSVHEGFTNTFIAQKANTTFGGGVIVDFWMGAMNLNGGENWTWIDGTPFNFTNWRENPIKKLKRSGQSCGSIALSDGRWNADDCYKNKPFVCKIPNLPSHALTTASRITSTIPTKIFTTATIPKIQTTTTIQRTTTTHKPAIPTTTTRLPQISCSIGWSLFKPTKSCFKVYHNSNWSSAEDLCKTQGAHLASFHSKEEALFISNLASNNGCNWINQTWVGLYTNDKNQKTWRWSDGSPVDYIQWLPNEPDNVNGQFCGKLWTSALCSNGTAGELDDDNCFHVNNNFVCKKFANLS